MTPWELNHRALGGQRKLVALKLHVSPSLVEKWCTAPKDADGVGEHSPLERLISIVLVLRLAAEHERADLVVQYFLAQLGYIPSVRIDSTPQLELLDVSNALGEFSEYMKRVAQAGADGILSVSDARAIDKEIGDVIRLLLQQREALRRIEAADDVAAARTRKGPRRALPTYLRLQEAAG